MRICPPRVEWTLIIAYHSLVPKLRNLNSRIPPEENALMSKHPRRPRARQALRELLTKRGFAAPVTTIRDYLEIAQATSERWQEEDWRDVERDKTVRLNDARIVGQVWFRGQRITDLSLKPGLYRERTSRDLLKRLGSPMPAPTKKQLFDELFELEHEMRIDFTSYGHLLNGTNHAKTPADWYFLMQHHGVPTRLLDWTTNALAALFFPLDDLRARRETNTAVKPDAKASVSVWMVDSYWLSCRLSDVWNSPLLAWSEDAKHYIPSLENLIDNMRASKANMPKHVMPVEPPAMHPRVAAQEGRFMIFGKTQDLLDEGLLLKRRKNSPGHEELRLTQIKFDVDDVDARLRELAQLGVSRRTLFPDLAGLADFVSWKHLHKVGGYKMKR
jgi:hypothetical protein